MAEERDESSRFLQVPALLESSQPKSRGGLLLYAVGFFVLVVLLSAIAQRTQQGGAVVQAISSLLMLGLMIAMGVMTWMAARSLQREQAQLEAIEELIQLRRWEEAATLIDSLLSR